MVVGFPSEKLIPNFSKIADFLMVVLFFHSIVLLGMFCECSIPSGMFMQIMILLSNVSWKTSWQKVLQMLQKFEMHDNQGELPSFTSPKISSLISICYMYVLYHFLAKSLETVQHVSTSGIRPLRVLFLNCSSCKIIEVSLIWLILSFSARQHEEKASRVSSTRKRSPVVWSIVALFGSGL